MGCNSSKAAKKATEDPAGGAGGGGGAAAAAPAPTQESVEEQIEIVMKTKRRFKNVFAEAVDSSQAEKPMTPEMEKSDDSRAIIRSALVKNFVFSSLREKEIEKFVDYMEKVQVKAGENIITQGEEGDFFYVVESGLFEYFVGGKVVGQTPPSGASFGELALLYGSPRAATVKAKTAGLVWALDRVTFRATMATSTAAQNKKIQESLSGVELLQGLTEDQIAAVADAVEVIKYDKDKLIIEKGTVGNVFYMIQEGKVVCTDVGSRGQFADMELKASEYFGERALLTGENRAANVTAMEPVTLLALDREAFQSVLGPLRQLLDENLSLRVLRSVKILERLSDDERAKVAAQLSSQSFAAGAKIITQGEDGDAFYIVKSGQCEVIVSEGGHDTVVKSIDAGDYFGEMALIENEPRTATVLAKADVDCFVLARSAFEKTLGNLKAIMERTADHRKDELEEAVKQASRADILWEDLKVVAMLGSGTFGRVKLVEHTKSKEVFALKTMHKSEVVAHRQQANVMNEKNIMIMSDHPFVLRLFNTYKDQYRLYMLLEFIQGGELFTVLHTSSRDGVPAASAKFYAAAVIMGLGYMHAKDIAYRDLKPENLMVDKAGYVKIVDFGFAKVIKHKTYTLCGTPEYLAPEIVLGRGHNKAVDCWATGVLIYEMIAGYSPFSDPHGMDQVVICQNIVNGKLVFPAKFDSAARDLVKKYLVRDPAQRIGSRKSKGYDDIIEAKWFEGYDFDKMLNYGYPAPWVPTLKGDRDVSNFDPYDIDDEVDTSYVDKGNWDKDF